MITGKLKNRYSLVDTISIPTAIAYMCQIELFNTTGKNRFCLYWVMHSPYTCDIHAVNFNGCNNFATQSTRKQGSKKPDAFTDYDFGILHVAGLSSVRRFVQRPEPTRFCIFLIYISFVKAIDSA